MSITIPEDSPNTGFAGDADAKASAPSGADRSMTEQEKRGAGWRMSTGFAGVTDAKACTTSGVDKSMTEPEEHAGWRMHTDFDGDAEVGTETTTALRFGWSV